MTDEFGLDIFRVYQDVTDWPEVAAAGVRYCWIKATNGDHVATFNAPSWAPAPADPTVAGCRSVGIAPGLYHFAVPGDPVIQADVFADEVIRLGCFGPGTLPPALDMEDDRFGSDWTAIRTWSITFLRRLRERLGGARVAFYASAFWMANLAPDTWEIDGLLIWCAVYGPNDGVRYEVTRYSPYRGRVDVHQYTSAGSVPGISSGGLDENHSFLPFDQLVGGAPQRHTGRVQQVHHLMEA